MSWPLAVPALREPTPPQPSERMRGSVRRAVLMTPGDREETSGYSLSEKVNLKFGLLISVNQMFLEFNEVGRYDSFNVD